MNAIHDHPRRHSITVKEYMRMGEAHVFAHDARLELIEGEIVEMAPIGSAHAAVVDTLDTLLGKVGRQERWSACKARSCWANDRCRSRT